MERNIGRYEIDFFFFYQLSSEPSKKEVQDGGPEREWGKPISPEIV